MRALLSVYDKTGLIELASQLVDLGCELISSGGTSRALRDAGLAHQEVEAITRSPEMLDGRVKTLHPAIHGGILADRSKAEHMAAIAGQGIEPIDLVVCNLYPFKAEPSIEMIDIGGPSMLRSAAKNHASVGVIVDPSDYIEVLEELRADRVLSDATRRRLARKAFEHTAAYDAAIAGWFDATDPNEHELASLQAVDDSGLDVSTLPPVIEMRLEREEVLRYGENPHQIAARYREAGEFGWWDGMVQHSGIALSYLNLFDADAAWRLVNEIGDSNSAAAAIIKHANPCGAAVDEDIELAYQRAFECDPVSAFGGIVALNRPVSLQLAQEIVANPKADVLIAPAYESDALALISSKKKNLRVLEAPAPSARRFELRRIDGGFLVQGPDVVTLDPSTWKVVTEQRPSPSQWRDVELAWKICAAVSSNAIVVVADGRAVGVGAGQQSRLDSAEIAVRKAGERARGGVCASDAFFPFRDGLDAIAASGISVVVQPGGSMRDEEVIAAADEHGIAMVFTSERHFRH